MHFFAERGIFLFFAETLFFSSLASNGRKWGDNGAVTYECQLGGLDFNRSSGLSVSQRSASGPPIYKDVLSLN